MNQAPSNDAASLQATGDAIAKNLRSNVVQAGAALADIGEQALTGTREMLDQVRSAVSDKARGVGPRAGDYVGNHPWACVGGAALLGAMLVVLARR